ncbi:bifunctional 4-hydroxy-2-oxoglutarate aldolase/2-dehydro-3-deoxy-phosphogluconate aldolase [Roseicella aquatilis]|uniref:Bifunctional 4-hydroxy-2-oxoglutarate aldolase/2-dehydro-3-deoxy-phosphogluconate aldolase n=1 Tax=Roseicella aquatilis TaxID=2527868 RepID=A0A4R4D6S5_9PROT|nr:bifunctional 4-hydroxy-2-oxoglutarate aldolase/2-dehydro-3-deoxy-phosphogluconate aldolase [Roseicella aquatilis]TCZ55382.1 bifunctional 4-hydroxy-2-oxoglutarate aldolase/2-dehydro-3-deoxy-phosphogluconate aldolase [Roseicella aquatilis]
MTHPLIPELRRARVVPVIRTSSAALAATACAWLREAGMTILEITLTIPDALPLIREMAAEPGLLVGAGTVPDARAAEACLAAGARFLVTPWTDPEVIAVARGAGACAMPGAMTPTEIRAALAAGADVVKIFPAASAGGPAHVRALCAVFPEAVFCPTGGVDAGNAPDYLAAGAAFVGIGGRLVDEQRIRAGDKAAIQRAARDALGLMQA